MYQQILFKTWVFLFFSLLPVCTRVHACIWESGREYVKERNLCTWMYVCERERERGRGQRELPECRAQCRGKIQWECCSRCRAKQPAPECWVQGYAVTDSAAPAEPAMDILYADHWATYTEHKLMLLVNTETMCSKGISMSKLLCLFSYDGLCSQDTQTDVNSEESLKSADRITVCYQKLILTNIHRPSTSFSEGSNQVLVLKIKTLW